MGNKSTKSSLRNAIIYLNISADKVSAKDEKFWNQIFSEDASVAIDIIKNISAQEIRMLRDGSPKNFALLAYKMIECLHLSTKTLCNTQSQQTAVLNAIRVLTRIIPCVFEDKTWHNFFEINQIAVSSRDCCQDGDIKLIYPKKSADEKNYTLYLPNVCNSLLATTTETQTRTNKVAPPLDKVNPIECCKNKNEANLLIPEEFLASKLSNELNLASRKQDANNERGEQQSCSNINDDNNLMRTLVNSICDLLFCPEFTVLSIGDNYLSNSVDAPPEDLKSLSTYDYVWEPGVGFESGVNSTTLYDKNRSELLQALIVCLSGTLYEVPGRCNLQRNHWIETFVSVKNRHALPLFTSLLNVIFVYRPSRPILQFTSTLTSNENSRETLVELAIHILLAALDYKAEEFPNDCLENNSIQENLFIDYMSRIHRDEDYTFMIKGFNRLINARSTQFYLWAQSKPIELDLELMLLFWKICHYNRKFMLYLLKSNETLDIVVPILYHLNENFQDPSRTALIHLGVFNLLILSGERNFGVKLNKQYSNNGTLSNLPEFSGTHADLMIIVFHKLIMYGYKINQLYDYLLNILVNISPYLKGLTMLASKCLIQLFETFSSTIVIYTEPNYHQLVIFLLEIFNNLIQYQFDSNASLIYVLLSKRELFIRLAKLSTSQGAIDKVLRKLVKRKMRARQMETATLEQQLQNSSTTNLVNNEQNSTEKNSSYDDEMFGFDLATVSCEMCPNRQEVSLVATPDIHHFTHPTHLFLPNGESVEGKTTTQIEHPETSPVISFDDILNEKMSYNFESQLQYKEQTLIETNSTPEECNSKKDTLKDELQSLSSNDCDDNKRTNSRSGKNWRPTSEWLIEWKRSLPLQTVLRMIAVLVPQVEQINQSTTRMNETEIIKFLQNGTLVGLLPVPHPILIRKYRTNNDSTIWFRACTWATIYVKSNAWTSTDIRLLRIL